MEIYPRKKNCCPTGAWDADLIRAGGVPPLGRRRSKLSTGQFLCTASVQVLSINRLKKEIPEWVSLFLVRVKGLEPSRSCPHKNLNLTRLPIPPHPHIFYFAFCCLSTTIFIIAYDVPKVNTFLQKYLKSDKNTENRPKNILLMRFWR